MTSTRRPAELQSFSHKSVRSVIARDYWFCLAVVLAALLHVLVNLVSTDSGLRIVVGNPIEFADATVRFALSDPVLLIVLLAIAIDWMASDFKAPPTRLKYWWIWLVGLTVWMAVSLAVGRLNTGEWMRWAYLNKGVGWLVLIGYFIAGVWIAQRGRQLAIPALTTFIGMAWLASAIGLITFVAFLLFPDLTSMERFIRPQGLAANPNAFAISIAAVMAIQIPLMKARLFHRPWWFRLGLALMMLVSVYAGSRSAWLGMAAGLIVLLALRQVPLREVAIAALLAGVINVLSVDLPAWSADQWATRPNAPSPYAYVSRDNVFRDVGLNLRVLSVEQGITAWQSRPALGTGLGSFLWSHRGPNDPLRGIQIHATPLWLLVETGVIGLLAFAAFFFAVMRALLRQNGTWTKDPVLIGIAAALVVLGFASIGTEILFQRYLWFLAGLGLAWPAVAGPTKAAK